MVSFFNDFIDLICFKSLHPTVNNSYEHDKYYHLHIEWWISNLAGVVWLRSTYMHKNQEGFLKWEKFKFNPPQISLKTDLNNHEPNPSWNHSYSSLGKQAQAACKIHVRQESHQFLCLHQISKERSVTGEVTLGFYLQLCRHSHLHFLYSLQQFLKQGLSF